MKNFIIAALVIGQLLTFFWFSHQIRRVESLGMLSLDVLTGHEIGYHGVSHEDMNQ